MAKNLSEVVVPLVTVDGKTVTGIRLVSPLRIKNDTGIQVIDAHEAAKWHEQPVQLLEGQSYDYELQIPFAGAKLRTGAVRRSGLGNNRFERGRLEPAAHTGFLPIVLEDASGRRIASAAVEIRSVKLTYRADYRQMLNDISEKMIDLLFDLRSHSSTWLRTSSSTEPPTLVQQFFLIQHLVTSSEFKGALARIFAHPHESTVREAVEMRSSRGAKGTANLGQQLSQRQPRMAVPESHPLRRRMSTIPRLLTNSRSERSYDTSENRFVKSVLGSFEDFTADVEKRLKGVSSSGYQPVIQECSRLRAVLAEYRAHSFFHGVSGRSSEAPLGSPVLQQRSGYREVLRAWLSFRLAASLAWDGATDVFLGGKRDVAALYEYWVFFELLAVLQDVFDIELKAATGLFETTADGITLKLKAGKCLSLVGKWRDPHTDLRVKFAYNRTFRRAPNPPGDPERSNPRPGSWTRSMRPDYTVSLWPEWLSEDEAEIKGSIVHLHFDAKYRIERVVDLFGEDEQVDFNEDAAPNATEDAKRSDLLKMHAYKDAIRRSVSAFVIYPGSENTRWREFDEVIPGLGAFALSPGKPSGKQALTDFLTEAANALSTRLRATT